MRTIHFQESDRPRFAASAKYSEMSCDANQGQMLYKHSSRIDSIINQLMMLVPLITWFRHMVQL